MLLAKKSARHQTVDLSDPNLFDFDPSCAEQDPYTELHDQFTSPPVFQDSLAENSHSLPGSVHSLGHDSTASWSSHVDLQPGLLASSNPCQSESQHEMNDQIGNIPQYHSSLPRRRSRYFIPRTEESAAPIFIPNATDTEPALDPMQRWQESPPEDEPASMAAIMDAVKNNPAQRRQTRKPPPKKNDAFRHYRRPPSTTSGESSGSSRQSANSAASQSPSQELAGARRTRNRVSRAKPKPESTPAGDKRRIFCCTFCCDRFKSKYDWSRHEKSLHLNLEEWICAPHGASVFSPATHRRHCAYCNALDPSEEHLDMHNYTACQGKNETGNRAFRRKDHLVQHLRLVHHLDTMPLLDDWKVTMQSITSRCGFCDASLTSWEERIDHLAAHFRKGLTMKDWKGDHGFPPSITAKITNSLPPYLIGNESQSMIPFSATNADVRDHFAQISSRAAWVEGEPTETEKKKEKTLTPIQSNPTMSQLSSFTEILTLHLSHYAREKIQHGVIPTDEMFQQESRRLLYDCEDDWNQTIADNEEWLAAFRRLHCEQDKNK
ncbi:hypothetical protein MW887_005554 [Aspergillus wentii]|nr:hypothetical protein MW887_005554 [Aspergillus wentii]